MARIQCLTFLSPDTVTFKSLGSLIQECIQSHSAGCIQAAARLSRHSKQVTLFITFIAINSKLVSKFQIQK